METHSTSSYSALTVAAVGILLAVPLAGATGTPYLGAEVAKLTPESLSEGDRFAWSIDADDDAFALGHPFADDDRGKVFLYEHTPDGPELDTTLVGPGEASELGASVALDGDTLVAGATGIDTGGEFEAGAALVYHHGPHGWTLVDELLPPTPDALNAFGRAVAVDGDTIAVAEPEAALPGEYQSNGLVHVFEATSAHDGYQHTATIAPPSDDDRERLGFRLALEGDTLIAGAPEDEHAGATGSVYVYERGHDGWEQTARLTADETQPRQLGRSLAFDGHTLVVGAPGPQATICCSPLPDGPEGHAFVFTRTDDGWSDAVELDPALSAPAASVGYAVALNDDTAFVASPLAPLETVIGTVAVFEPGAVGWHHVGQVEPLDAESGDAFGSSMAASAGGLIAASPGDDDVAHNAGAVYVFENAVGLAPAP